MRKGDDIMELRIEKINVSDNKFLITSIYHKNGDAVTEGDLIYSIESSKSTKDIAAPCSGFVFYVDGLKEYDEYPANFLVAQIVEDNLNPFDSAIKQEEENIVTIEENRDEINVIATKEALSLAAKHNVDLSCIKSEYITKWDVLEYIKSLDLGNYGYDSTIKKVAIIGAGRGTMQVLDLISHLDSFVATAIFDDTEEKQGCSLYGVKVVDKISTSAIKKYYDEGLFDYIVNGVGGSAKFRKEIYDSMTTIGIPYCNLIHPSVVIGQNVTIGRGNIIMPLCHIGPNTIIGNDCFFTAQTSIEHHNVVGSHCTFGPGVKTSGSVKIGECTRFGAGIYIEPYVEVGYNCLIASGAILTNHINSNSLVRNNNVDLTIVDLSSK